MLVLFVSVLLCLLQIKMFNLIHCILFYILFYYFWENCNYAKKNKS